MAQRIGGSRRRTRHKFSKEIRQKGKVSISRYFQKFNKGDKVLLKAEPAVQKGMYFPRFHGKVAIVKGKTGSCYEVIIMDGNKQKTIIVHPVHLKKVAK